MDLKLARFATSDRRTFLRSLDRATKRLVRLLGKRRSRWGLARKLLNIFLRDSLYTTYLNKAHGLRVGEQNFEIPLDSITAVRLRECVPELPRWRGVKYLDPATSAAYQAAALLVAKKKGMARVHLDADWWGSRQ